jgi:hypothetical protein
MLTSNGTGLEEAYYKEVVNNFDTFLESINTPIYDTRLMSNCLRKSMGAAGIQVPDRSRYPF